MFSKTCEYAIRSLLFIAQKSSDGYKVGIKEIAKGIDSPEHFTAKILQELSRRGLVQSLKGPTGGFYCDPATLEIPLAEVVRAIDGDQIFTGCALGLDQCSELEPCPLHHDFIAIRNKLRNMLQSITIGTFKEQLQNSTLYLKR